MLKKFIIYSSIILAFAACHNVNIKVPEKSEIFGLATPVNLQRDTTLIHLTDYFDDVSLIDSVTINRNILKVLLYPDKKTVMLIPNDKKLPGLSEMKVWIKDYSYSILLKKSRKMNYKLIFNPGKKKYKTVQIAGSINGWNPKAAPMKKNEKGIWERELILNPGKYQYQFVVDGKWILDPANPDSVDNHIGGYNSVMTIGVINPELVPVLFTKKTEDNEIEIAYKDNVKEFFVFWQNYRLPKSSIEIENDKIEFYIPEQAKKLNRSYIRAWSYNDKGISNDILIPLEKGKVVNNTSELTRNDKEASIIYFLMVDRFKDGEISNDHPVKDKDVLPKVNFYGGDIFGITQKIKDGYFTNLGINTIWISPIAQNPLGAYGLYPKPRTKFTGYHGYWPISSSKIDFRFGTSDEFKELIKQAHKRNINVILDYVSNHVHKNHPVYKQHPDWATSLYLPDGTMNLDKWDEYRLTTWFDTFLPTLDFSKPVVVNTMTDSALFWIKTYNLDGFRHDATKHVPEVFWRTLTKKLKDKVEIPRNKRLYQIGETYGNRELIASYVNSGEMDGQFDFNIYDDAVSAFAMDNTSFENLKNSLSESFTYYGYHNLMGYITGNQDKARFISYASKALSFDEDAKYAGWTRDIEVKDTIGYRKLSSLEAFIMTIPGIPVIYYGDEFGMPGANDPDNRRMMRFDDLTKREFKERNISTKLIHLRRNNLSLIYGDFDVLDCSDKTFAYARTFFNKIAIIVFNKNTAPETLEIEIPQRFSNIKLKANFGSNWKINKNILRINLNGNSFEILTN